MSTFRSDWPSAPDFHPEFGLLCPSPRRRRGIRLAMASAMAGMAIGATIELAVAYWHGDEVAQFSAANSIDEEPLAEGAAVKAVLDGPVVSARPSALAADIDTLTVTRPQGLCKDTGARDLAASFLNPECGSARPHARHSPRATSRIATVIVGRAESSPATAEPTSVTVAALESTHMVVGTGKTVIPKTQPVERPAPPKIAKAAPGAPIVLTPPAREPTQQDVGSLAFAAAPQPRSDYFNGPGDIFRAAHMPPSSGSPFGGIW
jgi:hypothetical protein